MVVHNLELTASQTGTDGTPIALADTRPNIDTWLGNHTRALTEQDITLSEGNTETDGSGIDYYRGLWRFDMAESQANILIPLQNLVQNNFEWAVVRYHECDHDEGARGGCSWDGKWEHGVVPDGMRTELNLDNLPPL